MDRNSIIGFILLILLFTVWMQVNNSNSQKELIEKKRQDSIALAQKHKSLPANDTLVASQDTSVKSDSTKLNIGGPEQTEVLENNLMQVTITNKGAKIKEVWLKEYKTSAEDSNYHEVRRPLKLFNTPTDQLSYTIPTGNGSSIQTGQLPAHIEKSGNTVVLKTPLPNGTTLEQSYTLSDKQYTLSYESKITGAGNVSGPVQMHWDYTLHRLEKNHDYEKTYATIFYKSPNENPDNVSYTKSTTEDITAAQKLQWVSDVNQFFNTTLIPATPFESAKLSITVAETQDTFLKKTANLLTLPQTFGTGVPFKMYIYSGPNDFKVLRSWDNGMEDLVQYGSSIMGTINRWIVRPIFLFLGKFVSNPGLIIFLLTLFVKLALFPLTYKMIHSQSKMSALKPQLDKLKEKHGKDQQQMQMETMKLYREFGVNPLGGCLPMVLQMPIWFALYRFFPAALEFRQAPFLWATDLSSYDAFMTFQTKIPMLGHHLSLFTVLWVSTTLLYTWYNFKKVDMTSTMNNPMMKYMQYIMPVMFLFFFNSYASGLTVYLVFSNVINIAQTIITKNYLIDQAKIEKQLHSFKQKPKKKGGFQERLNQMMQEQQRLAEQRKKQGK
jgi:YidC/Oxa1 family membrane protein insertase